MEIISRANAKSDGRAFYFTGKPCKRGHISPRYVKNALCTACSSEHGQRWRSENVEKERARLSLRVTDPAKEKERKAAYYLANKQAVSERVKRYRDANRDSVRDRAKKYYRDNRAKVLLRTSQYQKNNKDQINIKLRLWRKERSIDPRVRCARIMRGFVRRTLRSSLSSKADKTVIALGYAPADFRQHIERQFVKGMRWDNYGTWHIDHIIPLSKMLRDGITSPSAVNALSNLRPIWAKDNRAKGAKIQTLL